MSPATCDMKVPVLVSVQLLAYLLLSTAVVYLAASNDIAWLQQNMAHATPVA